MLRERSLWVVVSLGAALLGGYFGMDFGKTFCLSTVHNQRVRPFYDAVLEKSKTAEPKCAEVLEAIADLSLELTQLDSDEFYRALEEFNPQRTLD